MKNGLTKCSLMRSSRQSRQSSRALLRSVLNAFYVVDVVIDGRARYPDGW